MLDSSNPLSLIKLTSLMEITRGRSEIIIGLIDGPVFTKHPDFISENILEISGKSGACTQTSSAACIHGTFVAGILSAKRNSLAPSICPNCTLLVRPIFAEATQDIGQIPSSTPEELSIAIMNCIDAGVRLINLSVSLAQPSTRGERKLEEALDYAAMKGSIVVAASGNQGTIGSSAITRHPWVIPVVACDLQGRPISQSNVGNSIGKRGLCAPGDNITSLGAEGKMITLGGTSIAAPFVTGTIALLWSVFPSASAAEIKLAMTRTIGSQRTTIVPPLLDAWTAYQEMKRTYPLQIVW